MSSPKLKKVLFLITKSNWGGAQRYVYDLATALNPAEYEPVVALGGNGTLAEMLHHAGIRTITISSLERDINAKKELALARELYRVIRTERPDILHLNSSKAGALGALVGRLARVPRIIFTAHGWAHNEDRPWWQKLIIKSIHAATVLMSHHTIAVSHGMANELAWPLVRDKMTVINPGRSIGAMFTRTEAREKIVDFFPTLAPYHSDTWLVCVAELHPIKRHEVLFAAVRSLTAAHPQIRLLCFGEGERRVALETWIREHGMEEHIFLLGNLHEAARFLKAFDIFVLASKSESYGYVLHEAGLAKLPVVATAVGGIGDIISSSETGLLVPTGNSQALSAAIHEFLVDKTRADHYAASLEASLQPRTIARMAKDTVGVYRGD